MPNLSDYANPTEDIECQSFHAWLDVMQLPHTHIGNESGRGRTAMLRTAKLKKLGQSKGFPDYLIVLPTTREDILRNFRHMVIKDGSICFDDYGRLNEMYFHYRLDVIEMKRKKGGKLSPEQKAWLEILNAAGVESVVCKGFDEAKKFIEERIQ